MPLRRSSVGRRNAVTTISLSGAGADMSTGADRSITMIPGPTARARRSVPWSASDRALNTGMLRAMAGADRPAAMAGSNSS